MASRDLVLLSLLGIPYVGLMIPGFYFKWRRWQIYRRIGDRSIGPVTFSWQFNYPGVNFPGPNILEARIAAQPAELQADIQIVRRHVRFWGRMTLLYMVYLAAMICLIKMFG